MKIVIFCGGYGTRMWPASRKSYPKQFFPLIGGKSFFQITYARFRKMFAPTDIFVSTESKYASFIKKQAPDIPDENIIIEPERRDSLGAIGLVTAVIEKLYPKEVMFFSWSDHFIAQEEEFLNAVKVAGEYAKETGTPVSLNEVPKFASTFNGWLKLGKSVGSFGGKEMFEIEKFIEKPDIAAATKMFKSGDYLIHTGYGAWRSDVLLGFFKQYAPDVYEGLYKITENWKSDAKDKVLASEYHKFPKNSVEFGLFEKIPASTRVTLKTDVGWEDAGTWELFYRAIRVNQNQNVVEGESDTYFIDSSGNLIIGPKGKAIGVIGLSNVAVIDTPDGLLVANMPDTGKVKRLFGVLEEEKSKFVE